MSGLRYYSRQGEPITMEEWAILINDPDAKRVAMDETPKGKVSTVWLGLDHNFLEESRPLIFETLILDGPMEGRMERYSTIDEALKGHERWVALVHALERT